MRLSPQNIDIEIDKLTNSIENVITGDSFKTDVSLIDNIDLRTITKLMDGYSIGKMNTNNLTETYIN